ncbi:MAG: glycosyltransferase [Gemmatimonadaceae bacterium]|nr:glycosyltransferase [Chitinophagaceae bacterium]
MSFSLAGKKILFACVPADGHFNPLTGLAMYLKEKGCDVRWYTSKTFAAKIEKLGIRYYTFNKALDVSGPDFEPIVAAREKIRSQVSKLRFDMVEVFIKRGPEYFEDIKDIHENFEFDLFVADCLFMGMPYVKEVLRKPVISIGVLPLLESSKDIAPAGIGITPSYTFSGKIKQAILRFVANQFMFKGPNEVLKKTFFDYGIAHNGDSIFDQLVQKTDLLLQSGTPGFEYTRSDLGSHIRFIGSLLPYSGNTEKKSWFDPRVLQFRRVVLVTQGTVEKDVNKILVPTIEAFRGTDILVVATTGGSNTAELKKKYATDNIIIEDFIPFNDIMPYTNVYVTNGGYGGVMLAIENRLPMVVAGVHEGKNEIAARIGFFDLGINLRTEAPKSAQIFNAVETVNENPIYLQRVNELASEFKKYDPNKLFAEFASELMGAKGRISIESRSGGVGSQRKKVVAE